VIIVALPLPCESLPGAEVVKEDNSLTHDCDKCGYYHGYQVAAPVFSLSVHLPVSPIRCFHAINVTVDRRCA